MDELLQAHTENKEETRLYEAGYHLVPTITEEAVSLEVVKIKDSIVARGGSIVGEEMPKKMNLAYKLPRLIGNKRAFFDSSYFGWIQFEMPRENLSLFERDLKGNGSLIRFILLSVKPAEKVSHAIRKMPFFGLKTPAKESVTSVQEVKEKEEPHQKTFSETELDEAIKELIAE